MTVQHSRRRHRAGRSTITPLAVIVHSCVVMCLFSSVVAVGSQVQQQQSQQQKKQQTLPYNCIQDIRQIYEAEVKYEKTIINDNASKGSNGSMINNMNDSNDGINFNIDLDIDVEHDVRTYVLCPGMTYTIASLDFDYKMTQGNPLLANTDNNPPLLLRPNIHYKCGDDGRRSNLCVIRGGDVQITDGIAFNPSSPDVLFVAAEEDITGSLLSTLLFGSRRLGDNIRFTGLTFVDAMKSSFWSTKPGLVKFVDCEWTSHTNAVESILKLDFYDNKYNSQPQQDQQEEQLEAGVQADLDGVDNLVVRMENCLFYKNRFSGLSGAETSLITVNGEQNTLYMLNTVFEQNDMKWNIASSSIPTTTETHLIEALGPVYMDNNCFIDNRVTSSDITMYGNPLVSQNIYSVGSEGSKCAFASLYETAQQYEARRPICIGATQSTCSLDVPAVSAHHQSIAGANNNTGNAPYLVPRYVPFVVNALAHDGVFETDVNNTLGNCYVEYPNVNKDNGGLDSSLVGNDDATCSVTGPCTISHTETDEYFDYRFGHFRDMEQQSTGTVNVDITVRVSSNVSPKKFRLETISETGNVQYSQQFETAGLGWDTFTDVTWTNVSLLASSRMHTLRFVVINGGINFCSVRISYSGTPVDELTSTSTSTEVGTDAIEASTSSSTTDPISSPTDPPSSQPVMVSSPADDTKPQCTSESSDIICAVKDSIPDDQIFDALTWACDPGQNQWFPLNCSQLLLDNNIEPFGDDVTGKANIVFRTYWEGLDRAEGACCFDNGESGRAGIDCIAEIKCVDDDDDPPQTSDPVGSSSSSSSSSAVGTSEVIALIVPGTYSAMSFSKASSPSSLPTPAISEIQFNDASNNGDEALDSDPECLQQQHSGSMLKALLVDDDTVCRSSVNLHSANHYCAISTAHPNDYVEYEFVKDPTKSSLLITARMSSKEDALVMIQILKSAPSSSTSTSSSEDGSLLEEIHVSVTGSGDWNDYSSHILWDSVDIGNDARYKLRFVMVEEGVAICSVGVQYALGVA